MQIREILDENDDVIIISDIGTENNQGTDGTDGDAENDSNEDDDSTTAVNGEGSDTDTDSDDEDTRSDSSDSDSGAHEIIDSNESIESVDSDDEDDYGNHEFDFEGDDLFPYMTGILGSIALAVLVRFII